MGISANEGTVNGDKPMITMTYKLAMAVGEDAGNRNMRKHGRTAWNIDDWNASVEAFNKAYPLGNLTNKETNK